MIGLLVVALVATCVFLIFEQAHSRCLDRRLRILQGNHRILQAQYHEQSSWCQKLAWDNYELKKKLPPEPPRPSKELLEWCEAEDQRRLTLNQAIRAGANELRKEIAKSKECQVDENSKTS